VGAFGLEGAMKLIRSARVLAFGVIASVAVSTAAEAAIKTFFDPVTRKVVSYDSDKLLPPRPGVPPRAIQVALPQAPSVLVTKQYPKPDPKFDRQVVAYDTTEAPGTVIIDTKERFLYYVMEGGEAIRYGVGVGREGFGWAGTVFVGGKQEAPKWFPPPEMIERQPELAKYATEGMPGGEGNPLGVRALYLHDETGKDTLYRIHGTIEPYSIGQNVSSGCIRMLNENVTELYDLVAAGAKVIVS
jgi:lipoprotein-anchoring transpeptidase ErfK/SrfK